MISYRVQMHLRYNVPSRVFPFSFACQYFPEFASRQVSHPPEAGPASIQTSNNEVWSPSGFRPLHFLVSKATKTPFGSSPPPPCYYSITTLSELGREGRNR